VSTGELVVLHLLRFFGCRDELSWRWLSVCSVGFQADVLFLRSAGDLVAGIFWLRQCCSVEQANRLPSAAFRKADAASFALPLAGESPAPRIAENGLECEIGFVLF
jgi:hypothetical protein